jgi:rhodanese-related sulfurtransferase
MSAPTITPAELARRQRENPQLELIDVRTPAEFRSAHVEFARNVALDQLDPAAVMNVRNGNRDQPLYIVCQSGTRGEMARSRFAAAGYANVINVEGGTQACIAAGLPIVRGGQMMSLERQVRIAAGSLVLLGVLLSLLVHPWLIGLSAFVGAGLVFAGITDTCGMGLLLARMPWNRCA